MELSSWSHFGWPGTLENQSRQGRAAFRNSLDPTLPSSWIEIHPDSTILIRTGKSDFGQGTTFTAYRQIVADELSVPFEAITTVIAGDLPIARQTAAAAFDFTASGAPEHRAKRLPTPIRLCLISRRTTRRSERTNSPAKTASCPVAAKSISYGDLVKDQQLKLTIPVSGDLTQHLGFNGSGNPG